MGAFIEDTKIPEMLSRKYGLRSCEILDKRRYISCDHNEKTIKIRGKGDKQRDIHILPQDYPSVLQWYDSPKTISPGTLRRRLLPEAEVQPGNTRKSVTHKGRMNRYEAIPPGSGPEVYMAVAKELGHGFKVAMEHYDRKRIEEERKKSLEYLPE